MAALRGSVPAGRRRSGWRNARAGVFRLRKQLAPVLVVAGLWLAGGFVDVVEVSAVTVAAAAGLTCGAWWRCWLGPHLARRLERVYAAVCLLAGVGWLTLAAAVGL